MTALVIFIVGTALILTIDRDIMRLAKVLYEVGLEIERLRRILEKWEDQ